MADLLPETGAAEVTAVGSIPPAVAHRVWYRPLVPSDLSAVSALHASAFGPGRFARAAYRVREGTPPISPYCRGAFRDGRLLAALRMTVIAIGDNRPHLLLGPLAVAADVQGQGFGKALIADAITSSRTGTTQMGSLQESRFGIVLLVGDMPYYGRFGFKPVPSGQITFPGPVNPSRILAIECHPGALARAVGLVRGE